MSKPTRYFMDTEFLEDGVTIDLISIALVRDDGAEYYAINSQCDWDKAAQHPWLPENVLVHLPGRFLPAVNAGPFPWPASFTLDKTDIRVKPHWVIRNEVEQFIFSDGRGEDWRNRQFWACCGAYDWVALAQLWGPMVALPQGMPYHPMDIYQKAIELGAEIVDLPTQEGVEHDALADARHTKTLWEALVDWEFRKKERDALNGNDR